MTKFKNWLVNLGTSRCVCGGSVNLVVLLATDWLAVWKCADGRSGATGALYIVVAFGHSQLQSLRSFRLITEKGQPVPVPTTSTHN